MARITTHLLLATLLVSAFSVLSARAQASPQDAACERLVKFTVADARIVSVQSVTTGSFVPPTSGTAKVEPLTNLPPFCRVVASARRQGDTDVAVEVWLPARGWNGEFRPASSGFTGGTITHGEMADLLRQGWATANTNRGHDGAGPWKLSDMTSLPVHLMMQTARPIIDAYYGKPPQFTLMNACGGGGSRDALQLVQDWPQDLDAAAAVGFVYDATHHGIGQMWVYAATHKDAASYIPPSKYPLIHQAALNACDLKDGLKDGVIEDPPRCKYDPAVLLCKGSDGADCLTAPQVEAVKKIYSPAVHAKTGKYLFAGMNPGGELFWEPMAGPVPYPYTTGFYRNQVYGDQTWTHTAKLPNFDTDVDKAEAAAGRIDAIKGDISPFIKRGGKLLLVGGWNDHTLAPGSFVDYYQMILKALGQDAIKDSVRMFMVPGMDHCFTAAYTPRHDADLNAVLRQWKATGKAPETLLVTRFTSDGKEERKRLVCAYPKIAQYLGKGDISDARSFRCVNPQ
jgi:feruloyl esterase